MKYVGKAQVKRVKKFLRDDPRGAVKILVQSAALATVSSSGCDFFCYFSIFKRNERNENYFSFPSERRKYVFILKEK